MIITNLKIILKGILGENNSLIIYKFKNKLIRKLRIAKKIITLLIFPVKNFYRIKGKIYLYHGNLFEYTEQYKNPFFYGLANKRESIRDFLILKDGKFPFPNESVDKFQSEDVFEHLELKLVIPTLNEIHRILKKEGFFRLSLPDYRSPLLLKRTIYNYKGEALGDAAMGACAYAGLNSDLKVKFISKKGDNHLWLPNYEKVKNLLNNSKFKGSKITFHHFIKEDGSFSASEIPMMDIFKVQRVPPHDTRSGGMPISIVVDIIKN